MTGASIQTFMTEYGISMQLMKVNAARRTLPNNELERYRCRMSRQGRELNVYLAVPSEEGALTASDALFMLILDASGCEMFKDYYDRQDEFKEIVSDSNTGSDLFEDFWVEYESRCEQSKKLRSFLGGNLYEELINRFGFDN